MNQQNNRPGNRRAMRRASRALALSAALVAGRAAVGWAAPQSYNYTGATGGNWSVAGNWTQVANNTIHTVPFTGDSAFLGNAGSAATVNFNQIYTGAGLNQLTI